MSIMKAAGCRQLFWIRTIESCGLPNERAITDQYALWTLPYPRAHTPEKTMGPTRPLPHATPSSPFGMTERLQGMFKQE